MREKKKYIKKQQLKKRSIKKQPGWSIIIRTQGRRNSFLLEALYSIALQSYKEKQVILVVHSHNEGIIRGIRSFITPLLDFLDIKVVQCDPLKKRGHPLNVGLNNCTTKYVSFLDDDDILYPYAGEKLISALEEKDLNFACGREIALNQRRIGGKLYKNTGKSIFYNKEFNPIELVSTNFIPINDYIYNFPQFKDLRFDEELDLLEDWDFLLQLIFSGKLKAEFIPYEVSEYRFKDDNTQSFQSIVNKTNVKEARKHISDKYNKKQFKVCFKDIFLVYPDVNDITPLDEDDSDVGRMRKELDFMRRTLEVRNYQLEKIVRRKGFKLYNFILRIFRRGVY